MYDRCCSHHERSTAVPSSSPKRVHARLSDNPTRWCLFDLQNMCRDGATREGREGVGCLPPNGRAQGALPGLYCAAKRPAQPVPVLTVFSDSQSFNVEAVLPRCMICCSPLALHYTQTPPSSPSYNLATPPLRCRYLPLFLTCYACIESGGGLYRIAHQRYSKLFVGVVRFFSRRSTIL